MAGNAIAASKHKLKLKNKLGNGAFGKIYKGVFDGETVAVKTTRKTKAAGQSENIELFLREARALHACRHRCIIGFKALVHLPPNGKETPDGREDGKTWALVMEYAKHGTLSQRIVKQMSSPGCQVYSTAQALGWALDTATALEYLHMRSPAILHRDVKASNIMLTLEDGILVAKLSDFGLHMAADDNLARSLHPSNIGQGSEKASTASQLAEASNHTSSTSTSDAAVVKAAQEPLPAGKVDRCQAALIDKDSACMSGPVDARVSSASDAAAAAAAAADDAHVYSEVHDASGSCLIYVGSALGTNPATQGESTGPGAAATRIHGPSTHADLAKQQQQQAVAAKGWTRPNPKRKNSFRRPAHHPPGDAMPRLSSAAGKAALADGDPVTAANASLFEHWSQAGGSTGSSMCSFGTQCTWDSLGTAGSDCTDDWKVASRIHDEVETVFDLTGCTGSSMYMAPEVHRGQHYNEKSDVFSLGVVMYELLARTLLIFSELPTTSSDPSLPDWYAGKVADGYRPAKPLKMPDHLWDLISTCWHQDPLMRPHMSEVVVVLSQALEQEQQAAAASNSWHSSIGALGSRQPHRQQQQQQQGPSDQSKASSTHQQDSCKAPAQQGCCVIS